MLSQPLEQASACQTTTQQSILIVEDDPSLADVLSIRLKTQGFRTTIANRGQLGLTLARTDKPHLILLDLCLPDMDGFTVCQQLADEEETSEIPVIIVSGMERPDIVRRCRAAGCRYFIRKPYDPNALLTLIRQAIDEAEAA
jgi:CheY-like chemotaxis protein